MFDFFYSIKKLYDPNKINTGVNQNLVFLYGDTDSVIIKIKHNSNNIYKDFLLQCQGWMDFSVYNITHPVFENMKEDQIKYLQDLNKKVQGKYKNEIQNAALTDLICLGPKSYIYKTDDGHEGQRCKGITHSLTYAQYQNTLQMGKDVYVDEIKLS